MIANRIVSNLCDLWNHIVFDSISTSIMKYLKIFEIFVSSPPELISHFKNEMKLLKRKR